MMRHNLLNSVLDIAAENSKHQARVQLFEVGQIYLPLPHDELPEEKRRLAIVMTGVRERVSWLPMDGTQIDFFDLKGVVESLVIGLHLPKITYLPAEHPIYYPGRVAELQVKGKPIGLLGQLHPMMAERYGFNVDSEQPILAADFDLDKLLGYVPEGFATLSVSRFPAVQQDIAVVVDDHVPADEIAAMIDQTGGALLTQVQLFDVFRGEQIGAGKKSLAYSLTFQAEDRTLTDKAVAKQQNKIVKRLERELGAKLRS